MNLKKIPRPIIIFLISFYAGEFGLIAGIENASSNSSQLISKRNTCKADAFRCASGACINLDMLCNGIKDCYDGDDESHALCHNSCSPDKFHCKSGQCIAKELLCNGIINCWDGEDEKSELCHNNTKCKADAFRCSSGACLNRDMLCDGILNCNEGDDEAPSLCLSIRSETPGSYCILPFTYIENTFTCSNDINKRTCLYEDGRKVYHAERVTVKCKEGYQQVAGNASESVCFNGKWYPPISKCYKTCPPIKGQNMQFSCSYPKKTAYGPCSEFTLVGTKAQPHCKDYYHWKSDIEFSNIECLPNGTWDRTFPECVPDCGQSVESEFLLLRKNHSPSPWHVAIYDISREKPNLICGGTIISAQMIVSASHCFTNWQNNSIEDPKKYEVVVAKYTLNYTLKDESDTKIFKIREILVPDKLYHADIAILWISEKITFSQNVMPACVDWTRRGHYIAPKNALGKISGWGITESGNSSPILMTTFLPFINLRNCDTMVYEDFADSIAGDAFCAGINNKTRVDIGDSGGGLLFNQTDLQGTIRYYLRGISSNRDKTIRSDDGTTYIAVFTDVAQHIDWIYDVRKKIET